MLRFRKFGITCRFCGSDEVFSKVQIFTNNTKHLYCKCQECRKQWYASRDLIKPGMIEEPSKKKRKLDAITLNFFGLEK